MTSLHEQHQARLERRRQQMLVCRTKGWSDVQIAEKFGVSKQRVGQILGPKRNGNG